MSKSLITRLFVCSVVGGIAGLVLAVAAVTGAFLGGVFVMDGPDVAGVHNTPLAWTLIALALLGALAMIGASIGGLVAWVGALVNTASLEDKVWFVVLLVLGLLSFGFVAMIAYVLAGPDAAPHGAPAGRPVPSPSSASSHA
jgi:hypothetical protein